MKIGIVGIGKMADAMLGSWIRTGRIDPADVIASDLSAERCAQVSRLRGVRCTCANGEPFGADLVVLAVKPQNLGEVLDGLPVGAAKGRLVLSILAGKTIATIQAGLPGARVVRVMPNLPCLVGEGMSAWCAGADVTAEDRSLIERVLSAFGKAVELPESQFDAVTALSGSGPAFLAWVLDRFTRAAVSEGLSAEHASLFAAQTMLGTAKLLMDQRIEPGELIRLVASSKGTTAAGVAVLEGSDADTVLAQTITAAASRSRELNS